MSNNITEIEINEIRTLALSKKSKIKYRSLESSINGLYKVKIGGVGNKSIKLEIFLDYERLLANKEAGGLEQSIYNKLMELPKPRLNTRLGKQ